MRAAPARVCRACAGFGIERAASKPDSGGLGRGAASRDRERYTHLGFILNVG